jgi:hypothetical protein
MEEIKDKINAHEDWCCVKRIADKDRYWISYKNGFSFIFYFSDLKVIDPTPTVYHTTRRLLVRIKAQKFLNSLQ